MAETTNYSKLTLEDLMSKEEKMKSFTIPIALLCGFLIGIAVWSATHQWGFLKTVMLLILSLFIGTRYSQALKAIQAEISRRSNK